MEKGKRTWVLFSILAAILGFVPTTNGQPAAQILARLQEHYQRIKTLEAEFHQETTLPITSRVSRARGKMYLKLPGKMRWEYREGQDKLVVINNGIMWFYEPEERQVTVTDLSKVPNSQELLTFLTGIGDLRRDFLLNETVTTREGSIVIQLLPKAARSQWKALWLVVDGSSYNVLQTFFEGIQGEKTIISYTNIRENVELPEELFAFQIPEGVDVLHYPTEEKAP